jgi:hypothetical protein
LTRDSDMAFEVSYSFENEQQFWDGERAGKHPHQYGPRGLIGDTELDDIVSTRCQEHEAIDNSLRAFLNVTTNYKCMRHPQRAVAVANHHDQPNTCRPTIA